MPTNTAPTKPQNANFAAVVLAAGQGTRMKSERSKVLFEVAGRPLVCWSIETALSAGAEHVVVVVGHARETVETEVKRYFEGRGLGERLRFAVQTEQRGTGHAVACAMAQLVDYEGRVVVLYGDCPLVPTGAVNALTEVQDAESPLAMLTTEIGDPTGYGRILRRKTQDGSLGPVIAIREHKDCTDEERLVTEVNPGMYAIDARFLRETLGSLSTDNAAGELYLTDLVAVAADKGGVVSISWALEDLRGINDRRELALADAVMRRRINEAWARAGVTFRNLDTIVVDADVTLAQDVTLEGQVTLRGRTNVSAGVTIDVGCVLTDVSVSTGAYLKPYTVAAESSIGEDAQIGPFAHLRPASEVGPECRVGNFVEMKKTKMAKGAKANHLSYVGDGIIGERANIGAGTIFCNYDGFNKHTTVLEDDAFIGSDSQLVAPVTVGKGAYVATGTTVTRSVPANALAVGRARQQNKEGYAEMLRARFSAEKKARSEKK